MILFLVQLPPEFKDFLAKHLGDKAASEVLHTHCQRELFHKQWKILLNEEFVMAYQHGIVILCCDGIKWRFYPCIFMYSADYPEKSVLCYPYAPRSSADAIFVQIGF